MLLLLLSYLGISLGINAIFFALAMALKTDVFTDITYSLTFIVLALTALIAGPGAGGASVGGNGGFLGAAGVIPLVTCALVVFWALRLGSYLFIRILKIKVDHRFDDRRDSFVRFGSFWLLQAVTVWIVISPAVVLMQFGEARPGAAAWTGWVLYALGLVIEAVADWQKFRFKNRRENAGKFMSSGLWKYSRHPNYFGEILVWFGIALPGIVLFSGWQYLLFVSPVFITLLLVKVSGIPLLEKNWESKWGDDPAYREYRERTSLLIPLPPKR
jgi:steroid 5-alpha reductase family enzyme